MINCHIELRAQLFLFCFVILVAMEECSKLREVVNFKNFFAVWVLLSMFSGILKYELH